MVLIQSKNLTSLKIHQHNKRSKQLQTEKLNVKKLILIFILLINFPSKITTQILNETQTNKEEKIPSSDNLTSTEHSLTPYHSEENNFEIENKTIKNKQNYDKLTNNDCNVFQDTDFIKEFKTNVRPILDLYDELREILRFENFEFPKIITVGDQSAGKTSVLEAISKLNLPRGESTTTKCPTVIQLRSLGENEQEYALVRVEGEPLESARKIALSEIDQTIRNLQEQILESKQTSISDTPIYLNVHKRDAPDLTLYDMPGLTYKNPDEAKLIREMYIKFLQGKNTIILLVISGTSDFTSSEAISIIKENCPDFIERTYLILTKADAAASIDKKFQEKVINNPLGLRFQPFVVRHRNQEELEKNLKFEDAIKKEIGVLSQSEFSRIPRENKGTLCLVKKLVRVQKDILISNKRNLLKNLEKELINIKKKLLELPQSYNTDEEKYAKLRSYFRDIWQKYNNILSGNSNLNFNNKNDNLNSSSTNLINEGMNFFKELKIYFLDYKDTFSSLIANFLTQEFYERVKSESEEISNLSLPNLFENINFHKYILEEIVKTEKATYELVDNIKNLSYNFLIKTIEGIFKKNFRLRDEIIHLVDRKFEKKKEEVSFFISTLYTLETDKPYTLDDLYIDTLTKTKKLIEKIKTQRNYCYDYEKNKRNINSIAIDCKAIESSFFVTEKEVDLQRFYNYEILLSCFSYSNIVRKRLVDYVIRILMNKFVFYFRDNLLKILEESFSPLNKDILELIDVDVSVEEERKYLKKRFENIKNAIEKLNKVR